MAAFVFLILLFVPVHAYAVFAHGCVLVGATESFKSLNLN